MNERQYPVLFDGHDSDGNQLGLWAPDNNIRKLETMLEPCSDVLDIGSHKGDNSIYLAEKGHKVVALEENLGYIKDGMRIITNLGKLSVYHFFVEGSIEETQISKKFDAVICTSVLQMIKEEDVTKALDNIMTRTKDEGLNLLRVYTGTRSDQSRKPNLYLFEHGEIFDIYQKKGWKILDAQSIKKSLEYGYNPRGEETYLVGSFDTILAKKPRFIPTYNARPLDFWRRTNPDMADMIEAGTLHD